MYRPAPASGFSLIEMMTTIAILGILVAIGFPSFQTWLANSRIRNAAESIQNGLRMARNEAVQRATNVRFQLISSSSAADWTICVPALTTLSTCTGATVSSIENFASAGGAANVIVGATTSASTGFSAAVTSGLPGGVTFNSLGRPIPASYGVTDVVRIDASSAASSTRWLVTTISSGGQVRLCDPQLSLSVSPQGCN